MSVEGLMSCTKSTCETWSPRKVSRREEQRKGRRSDPLSLTPLAEAQEMRNALLPSAQELQALAGTGLLPKKS